MGRGRPKSDGTTKTPRSGNVESKEVLEGFGALGLKEAPVFYPTEEEFRDPLHYISTIRPLAEEYGICRIVPPSSWNPPFSLDPQSFSFPTKLQAIHQLQERSAACNPDTFKLEYDDYLQKHGAVLESWPQFCGEELDLCKLYNGVKRYGGYEKVKLEKKWGEVLRMVRPSASPNSLSSAAPSNLSHVYEKHLWNYELHQMNVGCLKRRNSKLHETPSNSKRKGYVRRGSDNEIATSGRKRPYLRYGIARNSKRQRFGFGVSVPAQEPPRKAEGRTDQICEQCHGGAHEEMMLLCDRCDRGWHLYCLSPPLSAVPSGNWYCLDCISSEQESFGFGQGQEYTLDAFRRMCDRFKKKWFGGRLASHAEIEGNFWDVVERSVRPVNVLYGSDIDTSVYGSGFPRTIDAIPTWGTQESWEEYAKSPWNLNNFPKLENSMLRLVDENIPGVIVPWLYIGMLFSSFCWHYEDHCLYSINYLHWGEPKCWYSVPGKNWEDFEKVMKSSFPDLFEAQPDLLFQLVTMLKPTVLREKGVPVCTTLQEPRNFIITFPRSYHGGFNHGFNCAEAVNFAPADWLPHGSFAVDRYRLYHKEAVLSHDELVCVVAKNNRSAKTFEWLRVELARIISTEFHEREKLWQLGTIKSSRMTPRAHPEHVGHEEDQECIICRYYLHLSAVVCICRPGKAVCLQHARQLCECSADKQQLLFRYSIAELEDLLYSENEVLENHKSGSTSSSCQSLKPTKCQEKCGVRFLNFDTVKKVKGRSVGFKDLAESWYSQACIATCTPPLLSVVTDLLGQAGQFLWAGHEMDQVRSMAKVLETASTWGKDIANLFHTVESQSCGSNVQSKVNLSWAQNLVAVDPLPCVETCLPVLKFKVQEACDLQQQICSSLSASSPSEVRALQILQKKAANSPFTYPEFQKLNDLLISAQLWSERLQKILSTGRTVSSSGDASNVADIQELRRLQFEGAQLPVVVPEKKLLDVVIKKVEVWQHHARQLLDSISLLQDVEEAVKEAEELPVYVAEAELLKKHIAEAEVWIKRAQSAKDISRIHADYAASSATLKDLILESRSLKIQVDEVCSLSEEINRLSWMEKASEALKNKSATSYLVALTDESEKMNLEGELVCDVRKVAEDALAWEAKAKSVLEFGACYEEFTELNRSSRKINAKLSGTEEVKGAISKSDRWLECAKPFLRAHRNRNALESTHSLQLITLQELVIEAECLPVLLGEAGLLRTTLVEAEAWCHKAAILESSTKSLLLCVHDKKHEQLSFNPVKQAETKTSSQNAVVLDGENDSIMRIQKQLNKLEELVNQGMTLGLEMPQILKLQSLASASRWTIKALRALLLSASLQDVESLVAEGKCLVVDVNICAMLENAIARAQKWLEKSAPILARFSWRNRVSKHLLEELLSESQTLSISLHPEVSHIKGTLEAHWGWVRQVQNASDLNSAPLSWSDLFLLQEKCESDLVECDDTKLLRLEVVEACAWLKKCRQVTVRSSVDSRLSLKHLLLMLQNSFEHTLEQLGQVDCKRFKAISQQACICQLTSAEPNSSVLCCDSCKNWYHPSCLGFTQFQPRTQKQFTCPFCCAISTGVFSVKDGVPETCFSQRLLISCLLELLDDSRKIHFRLEEKNLLEKVVFLVHVWQTQVHKLVAPAFVQYDKSTMTDMSSLLAALKEVGRIEVEEEGARIKLDYAVNAWRVRTKKILEGPGKPQFRAVCRSLKEAISIEVPSEDRVLLDVKRLELYASRWAALAKEVINDRGEMPVDEVQMLITKGEELPVALTKELAALRERSVLYCVCQKPYEEDRAMIACDLCGEWYHFTCIDLPEPDSSDEDCEDAIKDELTPSGEFFCPECKRNEHLQFTEDIASDRETRHSVVFTAQKHGDLPRLHSVRGKRTNRATKAEAILRQEWSSELLSSGNLHWDLNTPVEDQDQSESCLNANGRPCRRTAGRHSRFESFVMLTRSR